MLDKLINLQPVSAFDRITSTQVNTAFAALGLTMPDNILGQALTKSPYCTDWYQYRMLRRQISKLRSSDIDLAESAEGIAGLSQAKLHKECKDRGLYVSAEGASTPRINGGALSQYLADGNTPAYRGLTQEQLMRSWLTRWVAHSSLKGYDPCFLALWSLELGLFPEPGLSWRAAAAVQEGGRGEGGSEGDTGRDGAIRANTGAKGGGSDGSDGSGSGAREGESGGSAGGKEGEGVDSGSSNEPRNYFVPNLPRLKFKMPALPAALPSFEFDQYEAKGRAMLADAKARNKAKVDDAKNSSLAKAGEVKAKSRASVQRLKDKVVSVLPQTVRDFLEKKK